MISMSIVFEVYVPFMKIIIVIMHKLEFALTFILVLIGHSTIYS